MLRACRNGEKQLRINIYYGFKIHFTVFDTNLILAEITGLAFTIRI